MWGRKLSGEVGALDIKVSGKIEALDGKFTERFDGLKDSLAALTLSVEKRFSRFERWAIMMYVSLAGGLLFVNCARPEMVVRQAS